MKKIKSSKYENTKRENTNRHSILKQIEAKVEKEQNIHKDELRKKKSVYNFIKKISLQQENKSKYLSLKDPNYLLDISSILQSYKSFIKFTIEKSYFLYFFHQAEMFRSVIIP